MKEIISNPYIIEKKKERRKVLITEILLFVLIVVLWEVLARINVINDFLFSYPTEIIKIIVNYFRTGEIYLHIGISLLETILGLVIGTLLGIIIAVILWWNKFLSKVLDPFLVVLNALPKTALAPILIIWVGTGIKGITVVAISISVVITIISCYNYFNNVEEEKIKMFKSFGASKWQILWKLIIPSNIPNIISIIKINIGMTWVGVIVGEFLVSRAGIGYLIVYGSQVFKMDVVMAGVIILAIIFDKFNRFAIILYAHVITSKKIVIKLLENTLILILI